jgi:hypothetical protein
MCGEGIEIGNLTDLPKRVGANKSRWCSWREARVSLSTSSFGWWAWGRTLRRSHPTMTPKYLDGYQSGQDNPGSTDPRGLDHCCSSQSQGNTVQAEEPGANIFVFWQYAIMRPDSVCYHIPHNPDPSNSVYRKTERTKVQTRYIEAWPIVPQADNFKLDTAQDLQDATRSPQ